MVTDTAFRTSHSVAGTTVAIAAMDSVALVAGTMVDIMAATTAVITSGRFR